MRYAAKVDANQPEIVAALRKVGASVQSLAAVGTGVPDLLVGYRNQNHLLEVKDGGKVPSARLLTADQLGWHANWSGPVSIVYCIDDALRAIGAVSE